jgi:phosphoglycerate-specific signal transduction histidine kinase
MIALSDVTIRTRLILAMALSLALLIAVGLSSFLGMATVDRATSELHARWLPSVRILSEMKYRMASHRLRFVRAIMTPELDDREQVFAAAAQRVTDVEDLARVVAARLRDAEEKRDFAAAMERWAHYLGEERRVRETLAALSPGELSALVNGRTRLAFDDVNTAVNGVIAFNERGADRSGSEAVATFDRAMRLNLTLFGAALALMVGFVAVVVQTISRPIRRITETMHRLAEGDRTVSVEGLEGSNEIGRMAAAVDVFRNHLVERDAARLALEKSNEVLEEKVEARSAELLAANQSLQAEIVERTQAVQRLKAMQEEMIRTENLAVIGQLSAGVAHELNQPLAALSTLSDNALRFFDRGDHATVRFNLERIGHLVERMGELTGHLRSFARRSTGGVEAVDVGRSIDNALALLAHRVAREPSRVVLEPPPAPIAVRANAIRIEQILVNLVGNAFDATRGAADPTITIAWTAQDGRAVVRVADNGVGLTPEMETRVFEPFFTTKTTGDGLGLGLGLAISADIARSFGGTLTAAGTPEGGAVFTLDLPLSDEARPT